MGRIARSFELVGQSYRLLMQDKELMILPFVSGVLVVGVAVSFFFGFDIQARVAAHDNSLMAGPFFLMYVVTYAIGIFFQAAIVAGATERMRGGDPTLGSALAAAGRRIGPIVVWAILAATVGMILRSVRDRAGVIGRILVGFAGVAWSLATFFIVPVLVLEDDTLVESFARSVAVFKKTWGETFVGSVTLGVAAFCAWVTLVAVVGLLAWAGAGIAALAIGAAGGIVLLLLFSALQGIYVASLYQFATTGTAAGFDGDVLANAFVPKG